MRRILISLLFGLVITAIPWLLSLLSVDALLFAAFLWGPGVATTSYMKSESAALPLVLNVLFYGGLAYAFLRITRR